MIAKKDSGTFAYSIWYRWDERKKCMEDVMLRKKIIVPHRVRRISGSFAFLPHRFISDGFMKSLGADELLLYYFLVTVADQNGISYYGPKRICSLLKMDYGQYVNARDLLMVRDLIAYDETFFQVLELPVVPVIDIAEKCC